VLLVIFIPWSAVNLTGYFLVRRGNYDVTAFFIPDGVYGRFAWRGLLAYAIGLAAEWPTTTPPATAATRPSRWNKRCAPRVAIASRALRQESLLQR